MGQRINRDQMKEDSIFNSNSNFFFHLFTQEGDRNAQLHTFTPGNCPVQPQFDPLATVQLHQSSWGFKGLAQEHLSGSNEEGKCCSFTLLAKIYRTSELLVTNPKRVRKCMLLCDSYTERTVTELWKCKTKHKQRLKLIHRLLSVCDTEREKCVFFCSWP